MALIPSKLEKLKITAYENEQRKKPNGAFTVMFNPASLTMRHRSLYVKPPAINIGRQRPKHSGIAPEHLKLDLVFDGTGVADGGGFGLFGKSSKPVAEQIENFLALCFRIKGESHEPNYLKLQWGSGELKNFDCRLEAVDIEYTAFERNGAPLHAILKTDFIADVERLKQILAINPTSPDVSHARVVKSGDTLPLLTKEVYGSTAYYLRVAQFNGLDDFRNLTPGQMLLFPPLEKV